MLCDATYPGGQVVWRIIGVLPSIPRSLYTRPHVSSWGSVWALPSYPMTPRAALLPLAIRASCRAASDSLASTSLLTLLA